MNRTREIVFYVFLGLIMTAVCFVATLGLTGKINLYFSTEIMSVFSSISEISLYMLFCILAINTVLYCFVKKHKERFNNIITSFVYLLLATTIISVNVVIYVWVIALAVTILLLILSVFDIFPPKK